MKDTRRNFLKKATLGSAALTSLTSLPIAISGCSTASESNEINIRQGWEKIFEEPASEFIFKNNDVIIRGTMSFVAGKDNWTISGSRDGVPGRYALVDKQDNVQGYIVLIENAGALQVLFYHRTAQSFEGSLSFEGTVIFHPDSFPCRTKPSANEKVLSLTSGKADLSFFDALFSPEKDIMLCLNAAELNITNNIDGQYNLTMSGRIDMSSESLFTFSLENEYLRNRYVPYYHPIDRERCPKAPTGWMSWNTYFDQATADDNLAEAKIGQKYLLPFGCEFWHIESWQENSDKLPVRNFHNMNLETSKRKFPGGMKKLADDIRALGFRPGIWMAPFGTGNTEFYEAHKDWFLHDKDGKPLTCWNGKYTLDPTVPEARKHLKKIHDIAAHEWGYEYFKIDGMSGRNHGYCAHFYERPDVRAQFKDPSCTNPFELCLRAFREGMGEDRVFLGCQGHTSGPDVMYTDASRIGADIVHPNEPVKWTGVFNQGKCFMNQAFTHNIVTYADPDTLLVHDLPVEEKRVSATIVALPGQLTFFGDKLAGLSPGEMKILQQTLPPADVRPVSLYPYFSMLPVWNLRVKGILPDAYNVIAFFNWNDEPGEISCTTEELGIDSETEYILYEFWTQKSYGYVKNSFETEVLPHTVKLFAMHTKKDIPQWISSDRHIAQNASELKEYRWNNESVSIEGKISLAGTFPLTMFIHVPDNYKFSEASCSGAACEAEIKHNSILAVTLLADKGEDYPFIIRFNNK